MADSELRNSLFGLQSSTIDLDNYVNNDSVIKLTTAINGFFLTSVKKKSGDELEEEDNNAGNETQDSAAEDLDILLDQEGFQDPNLAGASEGKIDSKLYTPMNKTEFDFLR